MGIDAKVFHSNSAKPALVLVHGLGSAGTIWKTLVPELIKDFTVYAIDLPGHGDASLDLEDSLSPKALAGAILDFMHNKHGIETLHVAGNSLGGWIALEMASLAPEKVASVTALAPAGLWHEGPTGKYPPSLDSRILAKISQHFMRIAFHIRPLKAIGYKKITHLWKDLSFESCKDSVLAMANSKGYLPMWKALRGQKFENKIDKKTRVSIIFGDYDLTLPEEVAQEKSIAPQHASWIVVDNCAHVIMWNYPDMTVDFIRQTSQVMSSK